MAAFTIQIRVSIRIYVLDSHGIAILSLLDPNCKWKLVKSCLSFAETG